MREGTRAGSSPVCPTTRALIPPPGTLSVGQGLAVLENYLMLAWIGFVGERLAAIAPCQRDAMLAQSRHLQRLGKVIAKILRILQPDRQAQHAAGDAGGSARFGSQLLVGGGLGMGEQALGVAKIV